MVTDRQTDSLTDMPNNDPAQYTVLGWVKRQTDHKKVDPDTHKKSVAYDSYL